ncbi:MAG: glutathione S-transferase family protein [Candidatus Binatia bacterium]
MAIKLYDFGPSPNCQRVEIALHEKGLSYDIEPVDLRKREQKKPEFLKLNPYGKVPVIVDGQRVLFESCIINEYLDEQYPTPPLMPKDPYERARIRVLTDYGLNYIHSQYWAIRGELYVKKEEGERDWKLIEETTQQLRGLLQYLENEIGDKTYFMEEFTLLDIALVPRFLRMESFGVLPATSIPRLGAWLQRMKERPSVKANM